MRRRAHWYFAQSAVVGFRTKRNAACPEGRLSVGTGKMRKCFRCFCGAEAKSSATVKSSRELEEKILEILRGYFDYCRLVVPSDGAETSSDCAGSACSRSARLSFGQRGPDRPGAHGISLHPKCGERHAKYPEKCGAPSRDARSARHRDALAADHGTRAGSLWKVDRAGGHAHRYFLCALRRAACRSFSVDRRHPLRTSLAKQCVGIRRKAHSVSREQRQAAGGLQKRLADLCAIVFR